MKQFILGALVMLGIGTIAFLAYYFGTQSKLVSTPLATVPALTQAPSEIEPMPAATPPSEQRVGGDRDEHGCIGSAGYSWCEAKNKCLRIWEEACEAPAATSNVSDKELITQALYERNGWQTDQVTVKVKTNDGTYASGSVTAQDGGGYFFAAKVSGIWQIVADGNGVITCASLISFPDYPKALIPECYDETSGQTVDR